MIIIPHKALKLSPSLCKQSHKDDFLVWKKPFEHKSNNLLCFGTMCWIVLVKACLDIQNTGARQACSTIQSPLQHSEGIQRIPAHLKNPSSSRYLDIPTDVIQLHPSQKDITQMKNMHAFLQKIGLPYPQLCSIKTQAGARGCWFS